MSVCKEVGPVCFVHVIIWSAMTCSSELQIRLKRCFAGTKPCRGQVLHCAVGIACAALLLPAFHQGSQSCRYQGSVSRLLVLRLQVTP